MLSLEEVRAIAHLARLEVGDAEAAALQQQLNHIFEMIEKMRAVDTSGVEPMSHPQDVVQRLRPDRVTETDERDAFQQVAPQVDGGLYLVPKVIE